MVYVNVCGPLSTSTLEIVLEIVGLLGRSSAASCAALGFEICIPHQFGEWAMAVIVGFRCTCALLTPLAPCPPVVREHTVVYVFCSDLQQGIVVRVHSNMLHWLWNSVLPLQPGHRLSHLLCSFHAGDCFPLSVSGIAVGIANFMGVWGCWRMHFAFVAPIFLHLFLFLPPLLCPSSIAISLRYS